MASPDRPGRTAALAALLLLGGAAGGGEAPTAAKDEGVFDPAPVLRLRIELPDAARRSLQGNHRSFVRCTVREGETVYTDVGIHLKGSAGSFRPIDSEKPGFCLKFNKFKRNQRFHGLKKLLLNNGAQDPSYLSEMVGNELFRAAGVPAQRNGFALVEVNGRRVGFYILAEAVTRDFLSRWFPDASGNLYEGPGDVNNYDGLDVDSHRGKSDRADLRALAEAASEANPARRLERLEKVLDVDRFLSFLAMEAITSHWDGYAVGVNNYHLYHEPKSDRMVFMPHGTDQLFQQPGAPAVPEGGGLVARAVLRTGTGKRRYRERLEELVAKVLDPPALKRRIDELVAKVRPALAEINPGQAAAQAHAARVMAERIAERARSLESQIAARPASPGAPLAFDKNGMAHPGGWEPRVKSGQPKLQKAEGEGEKGGPALKIVLGPGGDGVATWRTRVLLPPGSYRFAGRVRIKGVKANPPGGADLRISRQQPPRKLTGDQDWSRLEFDFEVDAEAAESDPPVVVVELVCELQAQRGEAWFDVGSLELIRLSPPSNR